MFVNFLIGAVFVFIVADMQGVENTKIACVFPDNPRYAVDTDAANDPDDLEALNYLLEDYGKKLALITTTLYRPEEKAKACMLFLQQHGIKIPVSSGYGVYRGEEALWSKRYPCWPEKFGLPGSTNKLFPLQVQAYRKYFSDFDKIVINERTAPCDLAQFCRKHKKNAVLVSLAPCTNIYLAHQYDPGCLDSINRIVAQAGWFENDCGEITRLGYNTSVDLEASRFLLEQTKVPVFIVSSALIKKYDFSLRDKEREVLKKSTQKTALGKALCEDMHMYRENKVPAGGELPIADMLAAYIATHPEAISKTQSVVLIFNEKLMHIDMFHPDSKNVIKVRTVEDGNIHIIREIHEPENIRRCLIASLLPLFYPKTSKEEFEKLIDTMSDAQEIANCLNEKS